MPGKQLNFVTLTGNELTYIMNYIAAQGQIGTGDVNVRWQRSFYGSRGFSVRVKG